MSFRPSSFNDRQNAGEIVEVLNDHLPAPEPPLAPFPERRIKLTANSDQKKLGYKTLAMKLSEASDILDDRIDGEDGFLKLVMDQHRLDESAFGNASTQGTSGSTATPPTRRPSTAARTSSSSRRSRRAARR